MPAEKQSFVHPKREILSIQDMKKWTSSKAFHRYVAFLELLNRAVQGRSLTDTLEETEIIRDLIAMLDVMDKWVDKTPPVGQNSRFGNIAFRSWQALLKENSAKLVSSLLVNRCEEAVIELAPYLEDSFGNATRIDYGTGSHGVWCLDDFHFLPFFWGSSQLIGHERLEPSSYVQEEIARSFASQYMFMACIHHINTVKTGPFAEHSNQLWNISAVGSWRKMNTGLLRMYIDEVLRKFPVVQHFVFGTLLSIEPETAESDSTAESLKGTV